MPDIHASPPITCDKLWQFSLSYYEQRGIKEACLTLQNQYHGNVNLLLILKYLESHNFGLTPAGIQQLQQALKATDHLLLHYRNLRRAAKRHLPEALYREALQFELELEKQQQADLVNTVNALAPASPSDAKLVQWYCQHLNAQVLVERF